MSNAAYVTSPTRARRTKAEIEHVKAAMYQLLEAEQPATVRQVFYRMVSTGLIAKKEIEYKRTVARLLVSMRRDGDIPYSWIADSTRWMRKPATFSGLEEVIEHTARTYRRSVWENMPSYVEVWCEKEALAGVLYQVTGPWDVPLMVTRGYPSLSFLYEAAEAMGEQAKPVFIYYVGDHDPSGRDIQRATECALRGFQPDIDLTVTRIAVTEQQIHELKLVTRPTKQSDTRAPYFRGESVEADAISPAILRSLVDTAINQHIDQHELRILKVAEKSERDVLKTLVGRFQPGGEA